MRTLRPVLNLFYCYAHEDKVFRNALDRHLSALKRQRLLLTWSDQDIGAGEEWKTTIGTHLQNAHIILCLVSPDFLASDYCYEQEMQQALERHKEGSARVIPILIRPTYWENTPLGELQMHPSNALPVTLWPNIDAAWLNVVNGIVPIIQEVSCSFKTKQELLEEGKTLSKRKQFEAALIVYEQAIRLDPTDSNTFRLKSVILNNLGRYQEALEAIEQAIQLHPTYVDAISLKSTILNKLGRYQEALTTVEQVIQLDPTDKSAIEHKRVVLNNLKMTRHC